MGFGRRSSGIGIGIEFELEREVVRALERTPEVLQEQCNWVAMIEQSRPFQGLGAQAVVAEGLQSQVLR